MKISKQKVLQRLGYSASRGVLTASVDRQINNAIALVEKLIQPAHIIRSDTIRSNNNGTVMLTSGLVIKSTGISKLLEGCHTAYGFAVTIGKALEEKRDALNTDRDTVNALNCDAIGSVTVEEYAQTVQLKIKKIESAKGHCITRRFSPGYGDWDIKNQQSFLSWLEVEKIRIRLTNSCIMFPEKSISAILGVAKQ